MKKISKNTPKPDIKFQVVRCQGDHLFCCQLVTSIFILSLTAYRPTKLASTMWSKCT